MLNKHQRKIPGDAPSHRPKRQLSVAQLWAKILPETIPPETKPKPEPLCEACGRATEEINAAVSAKHFFLSVVEMFDNGQIKAFTLTPQDSKKLKMLIEAAAHP